MDSQQLITQGYREARRPAPQWMPPLWTMAPTHYGAVGDGLSDDTDAIQRAVNRADQHGGIVSFGPGVHRTTKPITIRGTGTTIQDAHLEYAFLLEGDNCSVVRPPNVSRRTLK